MMGDQPILCSFSLTQLLLYGRTSTTPQINQSTGPHEQRAATLAELVYVFILIDSEGTM